MRTQLHAFGSVAVLTLLALTGSARGELNWPGWRGPAGDGQCAEKDLPVTWDVGSVAWKVLLKGRGQSSPVVWGDSVFLTTALGDGRQRVVFCLDRRDGKLRWEQLAWTGEPEKIHKMNGWATATCATDGERVVAFFGKGGLHCYSVDGKKLWSRDLGPFAGPWGTSASPVIVGDVVIQNCDAEVEASLVALDKRTGATVWQTPRDVPERGGWSTPVLVRAGDRTELVLNGARRVTAYDPVTGKELWSCKSFNGRGEPTALFANGLVCVVNGLAGDFYAVRPGGSGDVTKTHMAWHTPRRGGRDQPSPVLANGSLLVANMAGVVTAYDPATGRELWKERLAGTFTSSPVAAEGRVYFQSDAGVTYVLQPSPSGCKLLAENRMSEEAGETFRASLTPTGGQFLIRSDRALYCVGRREAKGGG